MNMIPTKFFANRKALSNEGKSPILRRGQRSVASRNIRNLASPKLPSVHTSPVTPLASETGKKGAVGHGSDFLDFAKSSLLLKKWEIANGGLRYSDVNVRSIFQSKPREIAKVASAAKDLLIATAGVRDQSLARSRERAFADRMVQAVEQGIHENIRTAMAELSRFPRISEFSPRELLWIKFLAGDTVQGFRYENCQAFRMDSDSNLETKHDYVQVLFPSWAPSHFANPDLYIRDKVDLWKALVRECPTLALNINLNIQLNAIRMLHFWGFKFAFEEDLLNVPSTGRVFVVLKDNPNSPLHEDGDHNALRATRLIGALKMFGCFNGLLKIFAEGLLPKHYSKHSSYQYWLRAWENSNIPNFY
jgi:hypothetical protein